MVGDPPPQKIPLIFFRTEGGSEPVRDWLQGLPQGERQAIGKDLLRAQWRWPVGMPLCRPLREGLWEIRTDLPTSGQRACCSASTGGTLWRCMRL